jgi:hypothetical protein
MTKNPVIRRLARLAALAVVPAALAACSDSTGTRIVTSNLEVIVNSVDNSVTLVSADSVSPTPRLIGLGAQGTPVAAAARKEWAVVPLGTYPFAAILNLRTGAVTQTVPLPANSGATGAAFLNDSIAYVGNPSRNTVSPVNVRSGAVGAELAVGTYPQSIIPGNGFVYVLNANLVNFAPAGPGSVSVINAAGQVAGTIALTGINPTAGVLVGTRLVIINAGNFGANDGSLSIVNLATGQEESNTPGFGEFPGSVGVGADGLVYVGVYGLGIIVYNPGTGTFIRGLNNPIVPNGTPPVSALAFDYAGRLHTLNPGDCRAAGKEYGLNGNLSAVERTVTTGVCPFSITFTQLQQ